MSYQFILSLASILISDPSEPTAHAPREPKRFRLLHNLESTEVKGYNQLDGGVLWLFIPKPSDQVQSPAPSLGIETIGGKIVSISRPAVWLKGQESTFLRSNVYSQNLSSAYSERKFTGLDKATDSLSAKKVIGDFFEGKYRNDNRYILEEEGLVADGAPAVEILPTESPALQKIFAKLADLECKLNCALERLSKLEGEQALDAQVKLETSQTSKEPDDLLKKDQARQKYDNFTRSD